MRVTIDRIEGEMAVLEAAGATWDWPLAALPEGAAEGVQFDLHFTRVVPDTQAASARLQRLRARDPDPDSDDIDL